MNDTPILDKPPERIIQICLGADGTLYGLSNYGILYNRYRSKWHSERSPGELVKNQ